MPVPGGQHQGGMTYVCPGQMSLSSDLEITDLSVLVPSVVYLSPILFQLKTF